MRRLAAEAGTFTSSGDRPTSAAPLHLFASRNQLRGATRFRSVFWQVSGSESLLLFNLMKGSQMSIFRDTTGFNLQAFADTTPRHDDPHDPETGRAISLHSPGQRRSYLARNPGVDAASLPAVQDPNRVLPWDNASTVSGQPADLRLRAERRARNAALLADPLVSVRKAEPTKPRVATELSKYRLCLHEFESCLSGQPCIRPTNRSRDNQLRRQRQHWPRMELSPGRCHA